MPVFTMNMSIADKVANVLGKLGNYLPEAMLMGSIVLLVIIDLIFVKEKNKKLILGIFTIAFIGLVMGFILSESSSLPEVSLLTAIKVILLTATIGCVVLMILEDQLAKPGEHYVMITGILTGSFFLINSETLLTFYLSLEVMSISAYILTVLRFDKRSAESGFKYFIFGATCSAIMLFGISLVYGFSGTIVFDQIDVRQMIAQTGSYPVMIAFGMLSVGLLFKIAAAPQHIWSPDVYQTTNTSVVAYFSVVPKITGVIAFLVLLTKINMPGNWISTLLTIVAMTTIIVGNFAALWQQDVKRMLAYSSIAHTGFLLIPVIVNSQTCWQAFIFYIVIYMLMNIAAFALAMKLDKDTNTLEIKNYSGLGKAMPFTGVLLLVVLVSLTGLPPTAGFTAKLLMLSALWESYGQSADVLLLTLLVIGVLNTIVALFYYLRIPYYMFIKNGGAPGEIKVVENSRWLNYYAALMVFMLLVLFFKPDWLMGFIDSINFEV